MSGVFLHTQPLSRVRVRNTASNDAPPRRVVAFPPIKHVVLVWRETHICRSNARRLQHRYNVPCALAPILTEAHVDCSSHCIV
jgi:hypothetical protein